MTLNDRKLIIGLSIVLLLIGIAGSMDHWNTPNRFMIHLCIIYLPCLAVWFGRRFENPVYAIGFPTMFGAILILPGLLFFMKFRLDDTLFILAVAVVLQAIIAATSWGLKKFMAKRSGNATPDINTLRSTAKRTLIFSVVCAILFPQLFHPALLGTALKLEDQGAKLEGGEEIVKFAKISRIISTVALGIIATGFCLSALMAMADAFL